MAPSPRWADAANLLTKLGHVQKAYSGQEEQDDGDGADDDDGSGGGG